VVCNIAGVGAMGYGGRYIEPQGGLKIINKATGDVCNIDFRVSGWMASSKDNSVKAVIRDDDGVEKYIITGKYTSELVVENLKTKEKFVTYKAPTYPKTDFNPYYIYGMNLKSLQLNHMSDDLKAKLPPTDSRLRPDLR
jgi:hypothetical protein